MAENAENRNNIDLDLYCVRCNSDKGTHPATGGHPSLLWCDTCWDWQQPLPRRIYDLAALGLKRRKANEV